VSEPEVELDQDQDEWDDHNHKGFYGISDVFDVITQNIALSSKRYIQAILEQADFEKMSFYLVFNLFYSLLVRSKTENEEHDKCCQKGDEDHADPGSHAFERKKDEFKELAENGIEHPHSIFPLQSSCRLHVFF
jgi:hypothetical protein